MRADRVFQIEARPCSTIPTTIRTTHRRHRSASTIGAIHRKLFGASVHGRRAHGQAARGRRARGRKSRNRQVRGDPMALLRKRNGDPIVEAEELSANLRHCRAGARCSPIGWYPPRRNCARPSMAADKRCSTRISMMQLPQLDAPRRRLHRLELSAMTTRKSPGVRPGQGQSQPIRRLTRDRHDTQALRCYRVSDLAAWEMDFQRSRTFWLATSNPANSSEVSAASMVSW